MIFEGAKCRLDVNIIDPAYKCVLDATKLLNVQLSVQLEDRTANRSSYRLLVFLRQFVVALPFHLSCVKFVDISCHSLIADVFTTIRYDLIN